MQTVPVIFDCDHHCLRVTRPYMETTLIITNGRSIVPIPSFGHIASHASLGSNLKVIHLG